MIIETIFSKIIKGIISAEIIYQDNLITAFKDIKPQAPVHILIIPNIVIATINDVKSQHEQTLGHMIVVAAQIARKMGIADSGYRLIINCNENAGQEIFHIHMHLLGGKPLGPNLSK